MASIQDLLDAIPDVQDGDVITSDSHNSLKKALSALAAQLTSGAKSGTPQTLTLFPNFQAHAPGAPWTINQGFAEDVPTGSRGWIPVYLPDGAVIQQLAVTGQRTNAGTGFVALQIQPLSDTAATNLILIDISATGSPINLTGTPNVPGGGAATIKDLQTVKNAVNKYLIYAQTVASTAVPVRIFSLRVTYLLP